MKTSAPFGAKEVGGQEVAHDGTFSHLFHNIGDNRLVVKEPITRQTMERSRMMHC